MANLGPSAPECAHPLGTNTPLPLASITPSVDQLLKSWEPDVIRAARAWGLSYDATQDLAQAGRIALTHAFESGNGHPAPYLRRVITNAMRDEYRAKRLIDDPVEGLAGSEKEAAEILDSEPIGSETFYDSDYVKSWINTLPARLKGIFDLLYVQDLTQRAAAATLGLSKTRVLQLNNELLLRGRNELIGLAA